MRLPKTFKGYIAMFTTIEMWSHTEIKEFEELPQELQEMILIFDAEISNHFNEIKAWYEDKFNLTSELP